MTIFIAIYFGAVFTHTQNAMTPYVRLRQARIKAGHKTSADFARAHSLPEGTYRSHESGTRGLTRHTAIAYAQLLNVSVEWLLTGMGETELGGLSESASPGHTAERYIKPEKKRPLKTERKTLKNAINIAKEILENHHGEASMEEITDLAFKMLDMAEKWDIEDDKINAEMAEWLLTWEKDS